MLTVLLTPYMPESTAKLLAALGDERTELSAAVFGEGPGGGRSASCRSCSRSPNDRLPHPPRPRARARGRAGGRGARGGREPHPHDRDGLRGLPRRARRRPSASRRSTPPSAATPTAPRASTTRPPPSSPSSRSTRAAARSARPGLDYYRDRAPRADQERAFAAQIEIARDAGKPLVIHTRAAEDDTVDTLATRAQGVEVVMHCFSMPDRLDECLERGWWISFAGNVTYPKSTELAAAAERVPLDRLLVETDAPYLTPQADAQAPQPDRVRRAHRALHRRAPRHRLRGARAGGRGERRAPVRLVSELPAQPSLRRLKAFGIRPDRDLGQNFLIDSNLLDVIARAAELGPDDVVLEVGGGLGVLSEYLAERVAHVHVVEVDRRLEPALRDALDPHPNATLHFADAVRLDLAALDPAPTKVVANLPYGVAATVILRTVEPLPAVDDAGSRWSSARSASGFAARPGSARLRRAVGARPARVRGARAAPRVAHACSTRCRTSTPCSSACAARGPAPEPELRALVQRGLRAPPQGAAALAALALARRRRSATRARAALRGARPSPPTRAPRSSRRRSGGRCTRRCARERLRARAPGKVNLCLFVGEPREDGLHPLVSVVQALSLADELTLEPGAGDADEVVCPGVEGPNLAARALALFREATGWDAPPQRLTIDKRIPVAAGMGGGSSDAAATLRLAAHAAGRPVPAELAPRLGADVASLAAPRPRADDRRRRARRAARPPPARSACSCCRSTPRSRRPRSTARPTGSGSRAATPSSAQLDALRPRRHLGARQRPAGRGALAVPADRHRARRRARRGRRPRARLRLRPDRRRAVRRRGRPGPRGRGGERVRLAARASRPSRWTRRGRRCARLMHPFPLAGAIGLAIFLVVRCRQLGRSTLVLGVARGRRPRAVGLRGRRAAEPHDADRGRRQAPGQVDVPARRRARVPRDGRVRRAGRAGRDRGADRRRRRRPGRDLDRDC